MSHRRLLQPYIEMLSVQETYRPDLYRQSEEVSKKFLKTESAKNPDCPNNLALKRALKASK